MAVKIGANIAASLGYRGFRVVSSYPSTYVFLHYYSIHPKLLPRMAQYMSGRIHPDYDANKDVHIQRISKNKWFSYMKMESQEPPCERV